MSSPEGLHRPRKQGFTIAQNWVIDREDLSSYEKCVYLVLCRHADFNTRAAMPSKALIARKAGCSERKVTYAMKRLCDLGLVQVWRRFDEAHRQTSNEYYLYDDEPLPAETEPTPDVASPAETTPDVGGEGARGAPPPARHAPSGVHVVHPGGARGAPYQYQNNNTPSNNTRPAKSAKPLSALRDGLANFYQTACLDHAPESTWTNIPRQRSSCTNLAKHTRDLAENVGIEASFLAEMVVTTYAAMRERHSGASYWATASWQPSDLLQRWAAVCSQLAQQYETAQYEKRYAEVRQQDL